MPQSLEFVDTIINALPWFKHCNVSMLFYGPDITVPRHLFDDSFLLDYTMPGPSVIRGKLDFIHGSLKKAYPDIETPDEAFMHQAVRAALGQSAPMAESTFAHAAATTDKKYNKDFLQIVNRQTRKRIK